MKPIIVWRLDHQRAFDRALQLQFTRVPDAQRIIDDFRRRLTEGIEHSLERRPLNPTADFAVKYGLQRMGYQEHGAPPPPPQPEELWLEVHYRLIDDQTAEITSVTSPTLSI